MTGTQQSGHGGNPSFNTPSKSVGGASKSQGPMTANPGRDPQPGKPTPEDPRQRTPMQDPPLEPEQDDVDPTRLQGNDDESADIERASAAGRQADDPSPDRVVIDANETER